MNADQIPAVPVASSIAEVDSLSSPPQEDDQRALWLRDQVEALAGRNLSMGHVGIEAMPSVLAFMRQHYREAVTTEMLALIAHVGKRQLFKLFRHTIAQSPTDYLLALRMQHASRLLQHADTSVETVARQTGYEDAFFFSRRFKQYTGVSPRVYIQSQRTTPRVLLKHYVGFMVALDAQPIGAAMDYIKHDRILTPHLHGIVDIGQPLQFERMAQLSPDLIITYNNKQVNEMKAITDTTVICWDSHSFRQCMLAMGDLLERRKIAAARLDQIDKSCAITRSELSRRFDQSLTWGLICVTRDNIMIYTKHNMLYTMLGLQAPHGIQHLLRTNQAVDLFKLVVTPEQLHKYDMDILLIAVSPDAWSLRTFAQLQTSPAWQKLAAVRQQRVVRVDEDTWIPRDPFTVSRQLTELLHIARVLH